MAVGENTNPETPPNTQESLPKKPKKSVTFAEDPVNKNTKAPPPVEVEGNPDKPFKSTTEENQGKREELLQKHNKKYEYDEGQGKFTGKKTEEILAEPPGGTLTSEMRFDNARTKIAEREMTNKDNKEAVMIGEGVVSPKILGQQNAIQDTIEKHAEAQKVGSELIKSMDKAKKEMEKGTNEGIEKAFATPEKKSILAKAASGFKSAAKIATNLSTSVTRSTKSSSKEMKR